MILIRQHGRDGELFDLNAFLDDVAELCPVEQWRVCVQVCLGKGSREIEAMSFPQSTLICAEQLRDAYRGIYQTFDGSFVGFKSGKELFRLEAVDSSFWEVSGPMEFEAHMLKKYGLYRSEDA